MHRTHLTCLTTIYIQSDRIAHVTSAIYRAPYNITTKSINYALTSLDDVTFPGNIYLTLLFIFENLKFECVFSNSSHLFR